MLYLRESLLGDVRAVNAHPVPDPQGRAQNGRKVQKEPRAVCGRHSKALRIQYIRGTIVDPHEQVLCLRGAANQHTRDYIETTLTSKE